MMFILSESDDDEPLIQRQSSPARENSADMQLSDGEIRDGDKTNGDDGSEEEKQYQILDPTGQSYYQPSDFVRVITFKFYVYILEKF